jgi:hypothetical protein
MKVITRQVFLTKESIDLIDKDINAKQSYTIFSNKEEGTTQVDLTLQVLEEYLVSEELLETIIEGLLPALSDSELKTKKEQVKAHLRSLGLNT